MTSRSKGSLHSSLTSDSQQHLVSQEAVDPETEMAEWFVSGMPRTEVRNLVAALLDKGIVGNFLVRDVKSEPNCYGLTVKMGDKTPGNFLIERIDGGFRLKGTSTTFSTLFELVSYYEEEKRSSLGVRLVTPDTASLDLNNDGVSLAVEPGMEKMTDQQRWALNARREEDEYKKSLRRSGDKKSRKRLEALESQEKSDASEVFATSTGTVGSSGSKRNKLAKGKKSTPSGDDNGDARSESTISAASTSKRGKEERERRKELKRRLKEQKAREKAERKREKERRDLKRQKKKRMRERKHSDDSFTSMPNMQYQQQQQSFMGPTSSPYGVSPFSGPMSTYMASPTSHYGVLASPQQPSSAQQQQQQQQQMMMATGFMGDVLPPPSMSAPPLLEGGTEESRLRAAEAHLKMLRAESELYEAKLRAAEAALMMSMATPQPAFGVSPYQQQQFAATNGSNVNDDDDDDEVNEDGDGDGLLAERQKYMMKSEPFQRTASDKGASNSSGVVLRKVPPKDGRRRKSRLLEEETTANTGNKDKAKSGRSDRSPGTKKGPASRKVCRHAGMHTWTDSHTRCPFTAHILARKRPLYSPRSL